MKIELFGTRDGQEVSTGMQELKESKNHETQKFKKDPVHNWRDEFDLVVADIGELTKIR